MADVPPLDLNASPPSQDDDTEYETEASVSFKEKVPSFLHSARVERPKYGKDIELFHKYTHTFTVPTLEEKFDQLEICTSLSTRRLAAAGGTAMYLIGVLLTVVFSKHLTDTKKIREFQLNMTLFGCFFVFLLLLWVKPWQKYSHIFTVIFSGLICYIGIFYSLYADADGHYKDYSANFSLYLFGLNITVLKTKFWVTSIMYFIISVVYYISIYSFNSHKFSWYTNFGFPLGAIAVFITGCYYRSFVEMNARKRFLKTKIFNFEKKRMNWFRKRDEALLQNIFPLGLRHKLSSKEGLTKSGRFLVFDEYPSVTVMMIDIVGFTSLSSRITPQEIVWLLNSTFSLFDDIMAEFNLEKVRTIGDAYLCVANMTLKDNQLCHEERTVMAAIKIIQTLPFINQQFKTDPPLSFRVGIAAGPVVAGITGTTKWNYDIFGPTVIEAFMMEASGLPGSITISPAVNVAISVGKYAFKPVFANPSSEAPSGYSMHSSQILSADGADALPSSSSARFPPSPSTSTIPISSSRVFTSGSVSHVPVGSSSSPSLPTKHYVPESPPVRAPASRLPPLLASSSEQLTLGPIAEIPQNSAFTPPMHRKSTFMDRFKGRRNSLRELLVKSDLQRSEFALEMLASNGEQAMHSDFDEDDMDMREIMKTSFYHNVMKELNQIGEQGIEHSSSLTLNELGQGGDYNNRRLLLEDEVSDFEKRTIAMSFMNKDLEEEFNKLRATFTQRFTTWVTFWSAWVLFAWFVSDLMWDISNPGLFPAATWFVHAFTITATLCCCLYFRSSYFILPSSSFILMVLLALVGGQTLVMMYHFCDAHSFFPPLVSLSYSFHFLTPPIFVSPEVGNHYYHPMLAIQFAYIQIRQQQKVLVAGALALTGVGVGLTLMYYQGESRIHIVAMYQNEMCERYFVINSFCFLGNLNIDKGMRMEFLTVSLLQNDIQERHRANHRAKLLLHNTLPPSIAKRLGPKEPVIVDYFVTATVGFVSLDMGSLAHKMFKVLNDIFIMFDILTQGEKLEKIKTINTSYMVVSGVPLQRGDHTLAAVTLVIKMYHALRAYECKYIDSTTNRPFKIKMRAGLSSGPVVAGVIGKQKYAYDCWSDCVNTASRMESNSLEGNLQVTEDVYTSVKDWYPFKNRGELLIKGKGKMTTYILDLSTTGDVL